MTGPFTLWVLLVLEFFIVTVLVFAGEAAARLNRVERLRQFSVRRPLIVPPLLIPFKSDCHCVWLKTADRW
jgi:hypothetical protein